MQAVVAISGHGGWPMTVFLTPTGEPYFGGTYFPPVDRQGLRGFAYVLGRSRDRVSRPPGRGERGGRQLRRALEPPVLPREPFGSGRH